MPHKPQMKFKKTFTCAINRIIDNRAYSQILPAAHNAFPFDTLRFLIPLLHKEG